MRRIGFVVVPREFLQRIIGYRAIVGIEEVEAEWHVVLRVDISVRRVRDKRTAERTAAAMSSDGMAVMEPIPVVGRVMRVKHVRRSPRIRVMTVRFEDRVGRGGRRRRWRKAAGTRK